MIDGPGVLRYRCDLCGKEFDAYKVADLEGALESLIFNSEFVGRSGEFIVETTIHECGPGVLGLAALIGGHPSSYTELKRRWVPGWLMIPLLVSLPLFGALALIQPIRWMIYRKV